MRRVPLLLVGVAIVSVTLLAQTPAVEVLVIDRAEQPSTN